MGKNVKKVISLVLVFAMILTGMTFTGFDAKAADAANDTSATAEYEIYPTPHEITYTLTFHSETAVAEKTGSSGFDPMFMILIGIVVLTAAVFSLSAAKKR